MSEMCEVGQRPIVVTHGGSIRFAIIPPFFIPRCIEMSECSGSSRETGVRPSVCQTRGL